MQQLGLSPSCLAVRCLRQSRCPLSETLGDQRSNQRGSKKWCMGCCPLIGAFEHLDARSLRGSVDSVIPRWTMPGNLTNPPGIYCRKLYICYGVILMLVSPSGERFFDVVLPRTIESTINISLPERDVASEIGRSE